MSNILPTQPPYRADKAEAEQVEVVEVRAGEVELDQVIRAQCLSPQVVKRIIELEDCLWALAEKLAEMNYRAHGHLRVQELVERAKLLLKNRLEIPDKFDEVKNDGA